MQLRSLTPASPPVESNPPIEEFSEVNSFGDQDSKREPLESSMGNRLGAASDTSISNISKVVLSENSDSSAKSWKDSARSAMIQELMDCSERPKVPNSFF